MKNRAMFFTLFLIAIVAAAQAPSAVELTAEPSHHLLFENQYVRAFMAEVPPQQATLLHSHKHDYVFISIGAAQISNEVQGKSPVILKMQDGEARFAPGGFAHLARNLAPTPFRAVAVELLQDDAAHKTPPPKWDEERGLHILQGGTKDILFVQDGVRVSEVELQPGAVIPQHHHNGPHLMVAVSDVDLRSDVEGKGPVAAHFKAGEVKWVPGGYSHTVTNTGDHLAKFVTLEFQ